MNREFFARNWCRQLRRNPKKAQPELPVTFEKRTTTGQPLKRRAVRKIPIYRPPSPS